MRTESFKDFITEQERFEIIEWFEVSKYFKEGLST
jgi:hypothetical protein